MGGEAVKEYPFSGSPRVFSSLCAAARPDDYLCIYERELRGVIVFFLRWDRSILFTGSEGCGEGKDYAGDFVVYHQSWCKMRVAAILVIFMQILWPFLLIFMILLFKIFYFNNCRLRFMYNSHSSMYSDAFFPYLKNINEKGINTLTHATSRRLFATDTVARKFGTH